MPSAASASSRAPAPIHLRRVLLATDFSPASENALHHATAIASHYGAKLYLAHVVSSLGYTLPGPEIQDRAVELAQGNARALEAKLLASGALAGTAHEVVIRCGCVWDELERVVEKECVDLVVVGTHGRSGLGKVVLGSVAEEIFRHASCPVLTVGPGTSPAWPEEKLGAERAVLFPTDFAPASQHALPYAVAVAKLSGAKLVLLHVSPFLPEPPRYWYTADDVAEMQRSQRANDVERLKGIVPQDLQSAAEFRVEFGFPADGILKTAAATSTDLIVLGLQRTGHWLPPGHLPWAIAYEVVCGATCPVLTVRS